MACLVELTTCSVDGWKEFSGVASCDGGLNLHSEMSIWSDT